MVECRICVEAQPILLSSRRSVPSANAARLAASAFSKSNADNVSITASNRIQQEPDLHETTLSAGLHSRPCRHPRTQKSNDACLTQRKPFSGPARTFFPPAYNRRASFQSIALRGVKSLNQKVCLAQHESRTVRPFSPNSNALVGVGRARGIGPAAQGAVPSIVAGTPSPNKLVGPSSEAWGLRTMAASPITTGGG